jgi:hypothetical protein
MTKWLKKNKKILMKKLKLFHRWVFHQLLNMVVEAELEFNF